MISINARQLKVSKELSLSLKFYHKQIANLAEPQDEPYHSKVLEIRNNYLEALEKIEAQGRLTFFQMRREAVLKVRENISLAISLKVHDLLHG